MNDDLIKRLRDFDPHLHEFEVVDEAADYIEQLERKNRESALDALSAYGQAQDAYEAQLKAEAKVSFYEQKDGMDGAVVHAIRELLNSQNVPKASFIDDHVANAIVQRNRAIEVLNDIDAWVSDLYQYADPSHSVAPVFLKVRAFLKELSK